MRVREARDAGHLPPNVVATIENFLKWYGPPFKTEQDTEELSVALDRAWRAWWEFSDAASREREVPGAQLMLPGVLEHLGDGS